jgi:hypothetical protein
MGGRASLVELSVGGFGFESNGLGIKGGHCERTETTENCGRCRRLVSLRGCEAEGHLPNNA